MARALRLEFEGAIYHITARGNRRERVFATDADRARFLGIAADSLPRFAVELHAYVLLPNHFHFLVRTQRPKRREVQALRQGTKDRIRWRLSP